MKRVISFLMIVVMFFGLPINIFASTTDLKAIDNKLNFNEQIIKDDDNVKIVKTSDEDFVYIAKKDKIKNTLTLTTINKKTYEIKKTDEISLNIKTSNIIKSYRTAENSISISSPYAEEKTFVNYEYKKTIEKPNIWELRRPDTKYFSYVYFRVEEVEGENSKYLNAFRTAVNTIDLEEKKVIGSIGMYGLSVLASAGAGGGAIFTGGVLTPAAWASIITVSGFAASVTTHMINLDRACKDAYEQYYEVYTKSSNIL